MISPEYGASYPDEARTTHAHATTECLAMTEHKRRGHVGTGGRSTYTVVIRGNSHCSGGPSGKVEYCWPTLPLLTGE